MDNRISFLSVRQIARHYRDGSLSPVEVVDAFIERIERFNPQLNALVTVTFETARHQAKLARDRLQKKDLDRLPHLCGIPFTVKDTLQTAGVRTTFGSPLFSDVIPAEDAAVVSALKRAGGILLGKTNTPAFGWVGVTQNLVFGATPNPWNPAKTAGGSSGGAAVAACARLAPINIGTDGGGSLRVPAAFTGIVGFKPSYGRVPNYPTGANWSLQHIGPIARSVDDIVMAFETIAQPDERDPYSLPPGNVGEAISHQAGRRLRILFAPDLGFAEAIEPEIIEVCRRAVAAFAEMKHDVTERKLEWPSPMEYWRTIFITGAADRLGPFLKERSTEIEPQLREFIREGQRLPADAYYRACLARNDWWQVICPTLDDYDLLITPTVACSPFALGLETPGTIAGRAVSFYGWLPFCAPFNLTGQPAISLPAGTTADGAPVGMQIVGRRFADATVLAAGAAFEHARPWPKWNSAA
ncbi:MAG: aspartyl-tRNA(Asn)/glutamyl-tRNA(Gln) amidotransferase subunit [Bradyrhizobium sp.]|jgi:aspartyl-tRNA(Asn)/glutamyl-tRNA(Gln) amidotransferase subunit A|nr:aspartyl-tRNA(Asn)/glutamyl-tRNA(Gln) amidotransferase subunit [Bradyrhizobium sp.]